MQGFYAIPWGCGFLSYIAFNSLPIQYSHLSFVYISG